MNGWAWGLIASFAFSSLVTVLSIGKPREPLSANTAAAVLVVKAALAVFVYLAVTS